ncbi:MAG: SDR family NAD(P)-dependent oxidoreductase [Betaproteobacteria bacterium]|nr:SDR family NAD(P)-dependent oxidoreductase [Betaproteobacteria bacterium]
MDFANRTVVVTGAAGHLGRAVAAAFAERGANLALIARRKEQLAETFGTDGPTTLLLVADLLQRDDLARAVATTVERFGGIDVLCNITGAFRMGEPVHELPDATLDFLFDANVRTLVNAAHAVVPVMRAGNGGRIVNVAAFAARKGAALMGAYSAAKSSVVRLTEAMDAELREHRINVNCVLPTIIDTPDNRAAMPRADPAKWVAPQDLANVIAFLASDDARAVHGAALPVTGLV